MNLLDYRLSRGGIIELWILDSQDPTDFAFTSVFAGLSSAPATFTGASSVSGHYDAVSWFTAKSDTFYRLVLEKASSGGRRAALLTDAGEEILAHRLEETTDSISREFTVGLSHSGTPLAGSSNTVRSEVAIDFLHVTGVDSDAIARRQADYAFETWRGKIAIPYHQIVTNWIPDFAALGVTNFVFRFEGGSVNSDGGGNYAFRDPSGQDRDLQLRVFQAEDVDRAHSALIEQLEIMDEFESNPAASPDGLEIGDRAYFFKAPADTIAFSRNNVLILLTGGPSVLQLARGLDAQLALRSFKGPVILQSRLKSTELEMRVPTYPSKSYVIEQVQDILRADWSDLMSFGGDGEIRVISVPTSPTNRFIRLREVSSFPSTGQTELFSP